VSDSGKFDHPNLRHTDHGRAREHRNIFPREHDRSDLSGTGDRYAGQHRNEYADNYSDTNSDRNKYLYGAADVYAVSNLYTVSDIHEHCYFYGNEYPDGYSY
jgi:hypothetical protein